MSQARARRVQEWRCSLQRSSRAYPLPSWRDTGPKGAIVSFVEKVTRESSPDFVPIMMARCGASSRCISSSPSRLIHLCRGRVQLAGLSSKSPMIAVLVLASAGFAGA